MEKVLEKVEMGLDAHKRLTQMNKNRNVEDGIWGQVMCFNPPMEKKTAEEIRSGNPKSMFDKGGKKTDSFVSSKGRLCPKADRHLMID